MGKKFLNIKKLTILITVVLVFFTGFKMLKGKSFFDTIAEYQEDIYSENPPIEDLSQHNYLARYEENIPIKYEEVNKFKDNNYIVKKDEKIYFYDSKEKKESLIIERIDKNKKILEITSNEDWLIWNEGLINSNESTVVYSWDIWAKDLNDNKSLPFKVDSGEYKKNKDEQRNFGSLIPDNFSLDGTNLIYRKLIRTENKKSNIISDLVTSEIMLYNLTDKTLSSVYGLGDTSVELISNPKISNEKIAFEKRTNPNQYGVYQRAEVYTYNLINKELKKVIESENIISMDLLNNQLVVLAGNTDPSLFICDLVNDKKRNILYKGSKMQKYISNKENKYEIYSSEFLNEDNLIINYLQESPNKLSSCIYNIVDNKFYSLENDLNEYLKQLDNEIFPLGLVTNSDEIWIYLGNYTEKQVIKNKKKSTEEIKVTDGDFSESNEKEEIYQKFLNYKLK